MGSTPHSYMVAFSADGFLGETSHEEPSATTVKSAPMTMKPPMTMLSRSMRPLVDDRDPALPGAISAGRGLRCPMPGETFVGHYHTPRSDLPVERTVSSVNGPNRAVDGEWIPLRVQKRAAPGGRPDVSWSRRADSNR